MSTWGPGPLFAQSCIALSQSCFKPNINALGPVVYERNIFSDTQNFPIVASFWAPKGANPLICAHFNPHSLPNLVKIHLVV